MASYFEAFRKLRKRAMELKVQFPPEMAPSGEPGSPDYFGGLKPEIEFTIKRLNQVQLNNALFAGEALVRERGFSPDDSTYELEKANSVMFKLSEQLVTHFTDWKSLDGSELPAFNKDEVRAFVESFGFQERVLLGRAYRRAEAEDEKKSSGEASSATASSKPSETDSSTS